MDAWFAGLLAGFIATVLMTVVSTYDPHQTTRLSAMILGKTLGADYNTLAMTILGIVLHFGYGSIVGALAAVVAVDLAGITSWLWVWGVGLAVVLVFLKMAIWHPVSGLRAELARLSEKTRERVLKLGIPAHALYGACLGALVEIWVTP